MAKIPGNIGKQYYEQGFTRGELGYALELPYTPIPTGLPDHQKQINIAYKEGYKDGAKKRATLKGGLP